ncbi:MAG: DNA mismatch endonuclease Vsr [Proteobacteria bacterium]|nr:DNA mismatch endonuclease Vsr [Pseudomonadota bacterium]
MVDVHDAITRSRNMAAIRAIDTKPELALRLALFKRGFRYRLHDDRLPGRPDLVLPKHRAVIFIHGCFFHGHGCEKFKWPTTRAQFWRAKITSNQARDLVVKSCLSLQGWRVLTVWECVLSKRAGRIESTANAAERWLFSVSAEGEIG